MTTLLVTKTDVGHIEMTPGAETSVTLEAHRTPSICLPTWSSLPARPEIVHTDDVIFQHM